MDLVGCAYQANPLRRVRLQQVRRLHRHRRTRAVVRGIREHGLGTLQARQLPGTLDGQRVADQEPLALLRDANVARIHLYEEDSSGGEVELEKLVAGGGGGRARRRCASTRGGWWSVVSGWGCTRTRGGSWSGVSGRWRTASASERRLGGWWLAVRPPARHLVCSMRYGRPVFRIAFTTNSVTAYLLGSYLWV